MIWFTSDTHFGHARVLEFCERPWETIEQMNEALVARINACVAPTDELYVLGDFSYKITSDEAAEIRSRINCESIHLVPGNHDKDWKSIERLAGTFIVEEPIMRLKIDGQKYILCHFPLADWRSMSHGSVLLHGHIHSRSGYNEANRAKGILRYDVGVDAHGYAPVSLEQIREWFDGVESRGRIPWQEWV